MEFVESGLSFASKSGVAACFVVLKCVLSVFDVDMLNSVSQHTLQSRHNPLELRSVCDVSRKTPAHKISTFDGTCSRWKH